MKKLEWPSEEGWYWIKIKGYRGLTPCWFIKCLDGDDPDEDNCFLPAKLGDTSSMGIYADDIDKIGPTIIEPKI